MGGIIAAERRTIQQWDLLPFRRLVGRRSAGRVRRVLAKSVDMLDHVPMDGRDTMGDIYEWMLSKDCLGRARRRFRDTAALDDG